jgi:hypothetical protein
VSHHPLDNNTGEDGLRKDAEMQIDKTQNNAQVQGFRDSITQKDVSAKPTPAPESNVTIDTTYQPYTEQVIAAGTADDAQKIEEARKLLASGALDTPQAARKAAQNMLKFGI